MQFPRYEFVMRERELVSAREYPRPPWHRPPWHRARGRPRFGRPAPRRVPAAPRPRPGGRLDIHEYLELEFTVDDRR